MTAAPGTVYLVGAGCGQADLITVRGLELLKSCGVVVYDDLIDPALLDAVPAHAQRLYMGKRQGRHSASQDEICALLVEKAREGRAVVRLKGGDPFVFGRGGEEILALQAAGIPFQVVPGVTSAIAIPALAGVPVTHRGLSQSVHIITAHTADITKRGNCQIYTTSYVGNGKYGQANPNTLTFSRSPMIVLITDINNSSTMILFRGCTRTCHLAGRYASILTWNSGTASWWSPSSSFEQMNDSDVTYHVVALLPMD